MTVCGTGGWTGPLPGDPDNNSILTATPAFGGIDVSWTYPTTNPYAVAHTLLYRGLTSNFLTAIPLAVVSGSFYYDKLNTGTTYYYWIKIVSVNGTEGDLIGPASAAAKPLIQDFITILTGQIDDGLLAQTLKSEIDKITLNYAELQAEINNRISGNAALSAAIADLDAGVVQSLAYINSEIIARTNGDSALVSEINTLYAANATNAAGIQTEISARTSADAALASEINLLFATSDTNAAAIITERNARISGDGALATDVTALYAATSNAQGTANNAAAAVVTETNARTAADTALAGQITTVQSTLNNEIASVEQSLQTNINTVDGKVNSIGALYTVKVNTVTPDGVGIVGGFGIYNNGTEVQAGFDVDTFWIGRTNADKRKPFVISGGVVYLNEAVINTLTFSKLRDESGNFVVENGKVKANYLQVERIYGGNFNAWAWPASGGGFYLGPEGLLLGNYNTGSYLQLTAAGQLYAPGMSIDGGVLYIYQANVINTLNIAGNAVTFPNSATRTATYWDPYYEYSPPGSSDQSGW